MLSVGDLSKNFAGLRAVANINFSVERGTIVSLIGPNGAGKTSIFNLITGFYVPDGGSIRFEGIELSGQPPHLITRAGIARTFQNIEIFRDMSTEENVYVGCQCRSPVSFGAALVRSKGLRQREVEERVIAAGLMELFGLERRRFDLASALSYGEQRRLEIARALATGASLLLLDEPTAGMTPSEVEEMIASIARIRARGTTVLLIEHNMNLVMGISDKVVVLDHGVKIAEGAPLQIQNDPTVREAYLGNGDL